MKILICGACPESLTTVARALNRLRADQMRSELLFRANAPPARPEIPSVVEPDQSATIPTS